MHAPNQYLNSQRNMSRSFCVQWFLDIVGIFYRHCLNFLFITISMTKQLSSPWSLFVTKQLSSPWSLFVTKQLSFLWSLFVTKQLSSSWSLFVTKQFSSLWSLFVTEQLSVLWSLFESVFWEKKIVETLTTYSYNYMLYHVLH